MGQGEIMNWLSNNKGWHPSKEISEGVGVRCNNVTKSLNRLKKWGRVEDKQELHEELNNNGYINRCWRNLWRLKITN